MYTTQWTNGGNSPLGSSAGSSSPYTWWTESKLGNEDVHWEKVTKINFGADFSLLEGLVAGSVDVFNDHRTDILLKGSKRAVPPFFGGTPATSNLGEVRVKGYEIEVRVNKTFDNKMRLWGNFNMSHSKDKILEADDADLKADYQKSEGKQIGQTYSQISSGYYNTWDEMYSSTKLNTYDSEKLPGNLYIVDYNGDGVINSDDNVPYGYSGSPQNTYNATLGLEWKGFSAFVQFYGVNNVTRVVNLTSFGSKLNTVYDLGTWWANDHNNAEITTPRWTSTPTYNDGTQYMFDGSYVRLKNAEVAYTFNGGWVKSVGLNNLRIFLNGNNLWVWSVMPDDRESNFAGAGGQGAYPTMRRFNLGLKLTL